MIKIVNKSKLKISLMILVLPTGKLKLMFDVPAFDSPVRLTVAL